jgi:hypothetical protein
MGDEFCEYGPCDTVLGVRERIANVRRLILLEICLSASLLIGVGYNAIQIMQQRDIATILMEGVVLTQQTRLQDHAQYLTLTEEYTETLKYISQNIIGKDERNAMIKSDIAKEKMLLQLLENQQRIEARLTRLEENAKP